MKDLEGHQNQGSEAVETEHIELNRLLMRDSLTVREGFVDQIMARLPKPPWQPSIRERRSTKQWLLAGALAIALASVGGLLLRSDPATSSVLGSVAALVDLVVGTLLAGAGLLAASWSGLRTTVGGAVAESPSLIAALGLAVVLLNLVLFRLLRRRRAAVGGRAMATVERPHDR